MGSPRSSGVGERLRRAREQCNLTQEQLAERLDISVASINRWERNKAYPRADQRRRLAETLGVSSDELFGGGDGAAQQDAPAPTARTSEATIRANDAPTSARIQSSPASGILPDDSPFWDVRPAGAVQLGDPLLKQGRRPVGEYFTRACFDEVREALRLAAGDGGGGAVLFGPPMVGKTRMALEALRHEAADFLLLPWPRHEFAPAALEAFRGRRVALLLDDLHELTYQHEVGRILAALRRLLASAARLVVVATSRSGVDEAATHQHYDGLIESLGLRVVHLTPMSRADAEAEQFFAFVRQLAAREPARQLTVDAFDGTPGSVLLGLERRTTQLRSPRFPSAAKAILKAIALLRAASVYEYPESRVRRVAERVFELAPAAWSDALDYLVGAGWVSLDEGDLRGESRLYLPSDAYLDVCLAESGAYPRSNRRITSDFPKVGEALSQAPIDSEALFALGRAIAHAQGDISVKWNELGVNCVLRGLAPLDPARDPVLWARGQQILGRSYWKRWEGDEAENLRLAAAALEAAAGILTRESHPVDWATVQQWLGIVYIGGALESQVDLNERTIEHAIECLNAALEVYTRATFPYEWARTQNSLGVAYDRHKRGNRDANLQRAIEHYSLAAQVFTREAYPDRWALTMRNLAEVYAARRDGDRAAHEERAIAYCKTVLDAEIRNPYPYDWARTHHVLGTIYRDRSGGDRRENLRAAMAHYDAALDLLTEREFGPDRKLVLADLARAQAALAELAAPAEEPARVGQMSAARVQRAPDHAPTPDGAR